VLLPETVAVPTGAPPLVQLVGAEDCGPKTVTVIVPVEFEPEDPVSTEPIEAGAMAVPIEPDEGPEAVRAGRALATTVSDTDGQVVTAVLLLTSPAYDAYHQ
jgi:hypothetical protein